MNKRRLSDLLRSSGNYIVSTPSSCVDLKDLKKKEKASRSRGHRVHDEKSSTSLEPKSLSSTVSDLGNDTSSEYASMSPDEEMGDNGKGDSNMPSLLHLRDTPIDWDDVDKPKKTNLLDLVMTRFRNYTNPDIFIKVRKRQFSCHLVVLQCYSTYFRTCKFGQIVILPEDKVTPEGFANVYEWMLSADCVETILTRRNILDVFMTAQFLGVTELEEACWAFIDSPIFQEETSLLLYMEAKSKKQNLVMDLMLPRISKCFLPIVSLEEFNNLPRDVVCTLLRSNFIAVHCEAEVFMTAVKWLMHGWERRKNYTAELMRCVRFGFMDPWQLVDIPRNSLNPEFLKVSTFPEVRSMIEDGLSYAVHRYHYADNRDEYYRWIEKLSLACPEERNWIGKGRRYEKFLEFLKSLEEYRSEYRGKSGLYTMWVAPGTISASKPEYKTTPEDISRQNFHFQSVSASKSCD